VTWLTSALHRMVDRLAVGSRTVWDRRREALGEWVAAGDALWERWFRIACLAGLAWVLWLVAQAHHKAMWLLIAGWGIAAWRAGGKQKPPAAAEPEAEAEEEAEPGGDDGPSPDDAVAALPLLVGEGRGVLLTTLQDYLQVPDTKVVRKLLAEAGVTVKDGVRASAGNGPGVHVDHFPPPSPTASGAPAGGVGAGESANANANNVRVRRYESGAVAVFEEDPDNPHRTHIHWAETP
jgi:hypothetical protein